MARTSHPEKAQIVARMVTVLAEKKPNSALHALRDEALRLVSMPQYNRWLAEAKHQARLSTVRPEDLRKAKRTVDAMGEVPSRAKLKRQAARQAVAEPPQSSTLTLLTSNSVIDSSSGVIRYHKMMESALDDIHHLRNACLKEDDDGLMIEDKHFFATTIALRLKLMESGVKMLQEAFKHEHLREFVDRVLTVVRAADPIAARRILAELRANTERSGVSFLAQS